MKKVLGLIPARINSTRLPAKALLPIDGIPLIIHTYKRAKLSKLIDDVYVCTDSKEIKKAVEKYNGKCLLTGKNPTGTDRIAEAYVKHKLSANIVINIQGDEPLIDPLNIDQLIKFHLKNKFDAVIPTLKIDNSYNSPHIVKVIKGKNNKILFLSRAELPFKFHNEETFYYKHLSIISFKPKKLIEFRKLQISALEKIEGIEMMRALENNYNLGYVDLNSDSFAVDLHEHYEKAKTQMLYDKYRNKYE